MYKNYYKNDYGSETLSLDTLSSIPSSLDSVWVLREDFKNPAQPTTNQKNKKSDNITLSCKPTNSCLKKNKSHGKDKKGKNNGGSKTTKCVHYAPFLTQDICAYNTNNINTKKAKGKQILPIPHTASKEPSDHQSPVPILRNLKQQSNSYNKKTKVSEDLAWQQTTPKQRAQPQDTICKIHQNQKHSQKDLLYTSDSSQDELDATTESSLSSLSSLSSQSLSTLNSTFASESNSSPASPTLSLISGSETNQSFQVTVPTKNVRFLHSEDYETIESSTENDGSDLNYSDLNNFQLNPAHFLQTLKVQNQPDTMRRLKLKSSKTKSAISQEPSSNASESKKSKNKKTVDFSDFKFGKSKSAKNDTKKGNPAANFESSIGNKYGDPMTILNVVPNTILDVRSSTSSSQSYSSTQSSPKSSELSHTPTCEDSIFSSNLSTSSSSGDTKTTSSASSNSGVSASSSSSGVSSNISSASSTTSETGFTTIDSSAPRLITEGNNNSNNMPPAYTIATNGARKLAPKAVIEDDGDIRCVKALLENNKSMKKHPTNDGARFYRDLNQRASMRLPSESSSMLQRHASERLSHRIMPSNFQYPINNNGYQYQSQQQQQQQQQSNSNYQSQAYQSYQPFSQQHHQSQLAAAAAAAAAMDKEKQRVALIEYMKMQQQKIRPSVNTTTNSADLAKNNNNNSNGNNRNSQCYSNILPRKQMNVNNIMDGQFNANKTSSPTDNATNNSPIMRTPMRSTSNSARYINNRKSTPVISNTKHAAPNDCNTYSNNNNNSNNNTGNNNIPIMHHVNKTSAKRENAMGICYLMFGPETKRTLLPSQVTGIDTVKALFVRAFPDKLTMHFLDDECTIKIYIKDQLKELFYELDEMSDVKDRCVLKLVDLNATNQASIQSQPSVMATEQQQQSQPKQDTYYQLTQSNFIEHQTEPNAPVKLNDFYSSPSVIHQSNSFRYAPICQQNGEYTISTSQRVVKPHKPTQPPPVVSSQLNNSSRSSSEPRHNINPYSHVTNNSQILPETYDNIAEKQRHHQQQQQQQHFYQQHQHQSRIANSNTIYGTTHRYSQFAHQQQHRDIKSVDRDQVLIYSQSPSNRMPMSKTQSTPAQNTTSIKMGVNAKLQNTSTPSNQKVSKDFDTVALRQITLDDLVDQRSIRSESLTPRQQRDLCVEADADLTEDDMTEISYGTVNSCSKKCCPAVKQTITESNLAQAESLDETLIEDYESSKVKMRQMQEQLETLTNLVHKALANKDLNQLAVQINGQLAGLGDPQKMANNKRQQQVDLKDLNCRTKNLRQELMTVRKLHETLNLNFSDSMKNFIGQLNEKLNSFCRNEVNEKIKLDLIVYKYQLDSGKIEAELSDLENVVDDLRQNILKHKSNVSIDDVECYALALSQLSKQLVGLKSSFSSVREHLRSSNSSHKNKHAENKLAIAPRQNQLMTHSLNRALCKKKSQFQQQQHQVPVVLNGQVEYQTNNSMRKLFDDIEGIKPDNEQRLLAIEVDRAFNQLMTEISSVASEINTSLSRKSDSLSRGSSVSPMRHPADRRSYDFVEPQKQQQQMPNSYYHSLGSHPHRLPSYAKHTSTASRQLVANYNSGKKSSANNVLLNKIELVVSSPGASEEKDGDMIAFEEENNPPKNLFINEVAKIEPTEMDQDTDKAESMIEKRTKFRAQKQALKESKEQELANNTNSSSNASSSSMLENQSFPSSSSLNSSGANGSNSPASSFASSPSRTPTPSSPLSQTSSPTTTCCDANKAANHQLCNNLNNQLQTFAIQSKTIDRSFHLETVQEEDSVSISTDTTAKNGDDDKTNTDGTKSQGNINQLYDQLNNLKPIPRSNIPIKISKSQVEPTVLTSSMTIAPEFTDQDIGKKVQKSMIPINKVRFSQTFEDSVTCVQQVNEARTISSSSSSSSCASNSSGYNSDNNGNNGAKHHLRHSSGLKKSTEFFNNNQAAQSTMVVPRRHLVCHQTNGTNSPSTQKRVSLSVTDL